jgi:Domain of unknown function (DUF929)
VLNSDPEGPDIIEIAPDILDGARNTFKTRISRNRFPLIVAACAAVLAVVAVVAAFATLRPAAPHGVSPALATLITEVTTVPVNGAGAWYASAPLTPPPTPVVGAPLTADGKPEVFYVNAGYCPYCATENWALIVALSRFGTFSGLSTVRTQHYDNIPPVDGWMFYGSSFTSKYLAFVPVETYSNILVSAKANPDDEKSYRSLQKLTPAQRAVFNKYDATGAVPFLDFANKAALTGSSLEPSALAGKTWSQIAGTLRYPRNTTAEAILGAADLFTAEICQLTGNRPAAACPRAITHVFAN